MEIRFTQGFGRARGVVDLVQSPEGELWVVERSGLRRYDSASLRELDAAPHGLSPLAVGAGALFGEVLLLSGSRGALRGVSPEGTVHHWALPGNEVLSALNTAGNRVFALADGTLRGWQIEGARATALTRQGDTAAYEGGVLLQQFEDILVMATATGLRSYRANGLTPLAGLDAGDGLSIAQPSVLKMFAAHDQNWVLLGAAGSSSLSLVAVGRDGALRLADHLLDTRASRFGQISALEVVEVDGHVLVIAAGADAGLELLRLLPGGQLVHVSRLEGGAGLYNVTDIALSLEAGHLRIFVSSEAGEGLAQYTLERSQLGEVLEGRDLLGSAGDDLLLAQGQGAHLQGRAGDDMLVATGAAQQLEGGLGADIFVIEPDIVAKDRSRVVVVDFEAGRDQLDLSLLKGLRSISQLGVETRHDGITLNWRDLELRVQSHDSSRLSLSDLWPLGWQQPDRLPPGETLPGHDVPAEPAPEDILLEGGEGADLLQGGAGHDTLRGGAGPDRLQGRAGNDRLEGGAGGDRLVGGDGTDLILGATGDDWLFGNRGADTLKGGNGRDTLMGGFGADQLRGVIGDDVLRGHLGEDTLWGGVGNDSLFGGRGRDVLHGNAGRDIIRSGFGYDVVRGGRDSDQLYGERGNDRLWGQRGHDVLDGGLGRDWLWGGFGNDTLSGGSGSDVFVFEHQNGADLILDFTSGEDLLDLRLLQTVERVSDILITRSGADLLLDLGTGILRLQGQAELVMQSEDFLF
ncbi:hypothetical protein GG681_16070 [Epibacterium sp. SM1969]|uniref:Uncharacterized protein n=1 Tax=Tritonibacter aquimaris TaxID=2663379 RepID=A0A844ASS7_9RHOB|nr:calcium-binding protein [Tritonibacter aquimaris]MQY44163.1 hypothetical protein [Tritonibacter aquimaris]